MSQPATIAVVALKELRFAKSRMVDLHPALRQQWVLAMATDTVIALTHRLPVVVVSDQPALQAELSRAVHRAGCPHPVTVIADARPGLNEALRHGAAWATEHGAEAVLAAVADIPGLTPDDVDELFAATGDGPGTWFVADLSGVGTTMLLARSVPLAPLFGPDSAARHLASGAEQVDLPPRARCDIDTIEELRRCHGLGEHSRRLLTEAGLPADYRPITVLADDRAVTDDGIALSLTAGSKGELHRIAPGQRVHAAVDGDRVLSVWWSRPAR
ncbi:2-phospho-L-lactate guanylyltransferase [Enemella sp. A6]|uniref:2-phospho-L-lactate guanylyltransferase n=1 Tax=Enemella sp. A6 TaxID=3440152 RepID=UPI003EBA7BAA